MSVCALIYELYTDVHTYKRVHSSRTFLPSLSPHPRIPPPSPASTHTQGDKRHGHAYTPTKRLGRRANFSVKCSRVGSEIASVGRRSSGDGRGRVMLGLQ